MNYNQLTFWILFAVVFLVYWRVGLRRQNLLLLLASYVFYGFWDYRFLFLILVSTVIDFIGGLGVAGVRLPARRLWALAALVQAASLALWTDGLRDFRIPIATAIALVGYGAALPRLYALDEARRRKWFLVISMVANLGILATFKYFNFFVQNMHALLAGFGWDASLPLLKIVLPAGISFYTFQAMSYTIDIWRRECEPTQSFSDFALFVCFFPHLVAGPIMRAHSLLPQVLKERRIDRQAFADGLWLVVVGLFKKVALADNLAPMVNAVFSRLKAGDVQALTGAEVLVAVYAFAFQIYGDFSGYSSIARGISKWLGFELVVNFRQPYIATTPSDFWRRWHISLSSWLRDYLYIPLGGNRGGVFSEYRNLMITMLLGGLWHGASWTFIAWGLFHGVILCLFRALRIKDAKPGDGIAYYAFRLVAMFHLTCAGWLLFRAESFATVTRAVNLLVFHMHPNGLAATALLLTAFYAMVLFAFEVWVEGEERLDKVRRAPWLVQGACYAYFVVMMVFFHAGKSFEFIYFQF